MKKNRKYQYFLTIILLSSCASTNIANETLNTPKESNNLISVNNDNKVFEDFLKNQWDEGLADSPVFASMLGNKKYNQLISSNSIEQFNINKSKSAAALEKLQAFDINSLNENNKLNYRLAELGMKNDINRMKYPTYFMQLNQRGGVQSYYETGDRLIYSSQQDYKDWLIRLEAYAKNISNSLVNNKEALV